jgi:hypothetical protein
MALIAAHKVHGTWCYGCNKQVGRQSEHLAWLIMPAGVDYILEGRVLPDAQA